MKDDGLKQLGFHSIPTINPLEEECAPWTRHYQLVQEEHDLAQYIGTLSMVECQDCHLERLCPYKFKEDEESIRGCYDRLGMDLMSPIKDGMTDHDKIVMTLEASLEQLKKIRSRICWLDSHARYELMETFNYDLIECEITSLNMAIKFLERQIKRAKDGECKYDKTNFTGLE